MVVEAGALVEDSILMHGVHVGAGAVVHRAVLDKGVQVGTGVRIEAGDAKVINVQYEKCSLAGMTVVAKDVCLPAGLSLGSAVVVEAGVKESNFPSSVPPGATISPDC